MTSKSKVRPDLQVIPMLSHETLYVGIDVGKGTHVVGFISTTLLSLHVQKRQAGLLKTDKRDALELGNLLYNQLEKGVQVGDPMQAVRRQAPPTDADAQLRGMVRHCYELIAESTQRKNKLTSICDEVFLEFTTVCKNPNLP